MNINQQLLYEDFIERKYSITLQAKGWFHTNLCCHLVYKRIDILQIVGD